MLPASKSGNIRTFALPATVDSGALEDAILGIIAASNCNSPSQVKSGAFYRPEVTGW